MRFCENCDYYSILIDISENWLFVFFCILLLRNMQTLIHGHLLFFNGLENIPLIVLAAWVGRTIVGLGWTGRAVGRGPRPSGPPGGAEIAGKDEGRVRELPTRVAHVNSQVRVKLPAPHIRERGPLAYPVFGWTVTASVDRPAGVLLVLYPLLRSARHVLHGWQHPDDGLSLLPPLKGHPYGSVRVHPKLLKPHTPLLLLLPPLL